MNKINPVLENLRETTIESIEKLYLTGLSYKASAKRVFDCCKKSKVNTGFTMISFESFYNAYKIQKTRNKKLNETETEFIEF